MNKNVMTGPLYIVKGLRYEINDDLRLMVKHLLSVFNGIGIAGANEARIEGCSSDVNDFGDDGNSPTGYSLNLWIKKFNILE